MTTQNFTDAQIEEEAKSFILRAGFSWGWENLESWARRMAERAALELLVERQARSVAVSDEDVRAAFEHRLICDDTNPENPPRNKRGEYIDEEVSESWKVWKSAIDFAHSHGAAGAVRVPAAIVELSECRTRGWNDSAPAYRAGWNDCRAAALAAATQEKAS